jgi:hypothetical protein
MTYIFTCNAKVQYVSFNRKDEKEIRHSASRATSIAALAWDRLETAAQAAMTNGHASPSVQLVADTRGITALIKDEHGTTVTVQAGRVSVSVDGVQENKDA